jgi:hypothetical protein
VTTRSGATNGDEQETFEIFEDIRFKILHDGESYLKLLINWEKPRQRSRYSDMLRAGSILIRGQN